MIRDELSPFGFHSLFVLNYIIRNAELPAAARGNGRHGTVDLLRLDILEPTQQRLRQPVSLGFAQSLLRRPIHESVRHHLPHHTLSLRQRSPPDLRQP